MVKAKSKTGTDIDERILQQYTDVTKPGSSSGLNKIARQLRVKNKTVKKALLSTDGYTLHTPIRKRFPRRSVISPGPGD